MASESTQLQYNFKTKAGTLLNVYADGGDDAEVQLQALADSLPKVDEIEKLLGALETVQNAFSGPGAQAPASAPSQAAPAATPGEHECRHGAMVYREGVSKGSGKPYKMWACPSRDRNDQCDPTWIR